MALKCRAEEMVLLEDRVLVKAELEEKTSGGLFIPDGAKETPVEGIVVVVGPGAFIPEVGGCAPMYVKPGAHVLYGKYAGTQIRFDGDEAVYLILRQPDILAWLPAGKEAAGGQG